jgi:hypothetical protein
MRKIIGFSVLWPWLRYRFASRRRSVLRRSNYSRSASPLSHAERLGALARLALALYASLSPGVTRTFIRTLAGSFLGGCPLRFGSMGGLCTHK